MKIRNIKNPTSERQNPTLLEPRRCQCSQHQVNIFNVFKVQKNFFSANVLSEKSNPDPSLIAKSRSMSKRVKLNVGGIRCKSKNHLKNISNMVSDMK